MFASLKFIDVADKEIYEAELLLMENPAHGSMLGIDTFLIAHGFYEPSGDTVKTDGLTQGYNALSSDKKTEDARMLASIDFSQQAYSKVRDVLEGIAMKKGEDSIIVSRENDGNGRGVWGLARPLNREEREAVMNVVPGVRFRRAGTPSADI